MTNSRGGTGKPEDPSLSQELEEIEPPEGAEDPIQTNQDPAETLCLDGVDDAGNESANIIKSDEERLQTLPPNKRILALLGFYEYIEEKPLPKSFKSIQVRIPRKDLPQVREIMESENGINPLAFPISENFLGSKEDEYVTLSYIVPHKDPISPNLKIISNKLNQIGITAEIFVSKNNPLAVKIKDDGILILGADYESLTQTGLAEIKEEQAISPDESLVTTDCIKSAEYEQTQLDRGKLSKLQENEKCFCLMIKDDFIEKMNEKGLEDPYLNTILGQIRVIFQSEFFHITAQNGYLLIVNTAERGGAYLTNIADKFKKVSEGSAKIFLKAGEIKKSNGYFEISGYPTAKEIEGIFSKVNNGVWLHESTYDAGNNMLKGRSGGKNTIATQDEENEEWYEFIEQLGSKEFHVGGPDRMIGNKEEFKTVNDALSDKETRLIMLKGSAGMGKSRLLTEIFKKNPSMLGFIMDSANETVPGGSLIEFTDKLMEKVKENFDEKDKKNLGASVRAYMKKTDDQKIQIAQISPNELIEICMQSFKFLQNKLGDVQICVDDTHYIDRHSEGYMMTIFSELLARKNNNKVLLSSRPEEIYSSLAQELLEKEVNTRGKKKGNAVKTVNVKGLNFLTPKIARDFVFYSLPEKLRNENGDELELADWYIELGKAAGTTPLIMVEFMNEILAAYKKNPLILTVSDGKINLDSTFLKSLLDDMQSHVEMDAIYKNKMKKLSSEKLRLFLQLFSMLGDFLTSKQIVKLQNITGEISQEEFEELEDGCYLFGSLYSIMRTPHSLVTQSYKSSMDSQIRNEKSMELYNLFADDESISEDAKLNLLHYAGQTITLDPKNDFWRIYNKRTSITYEKAVKNNAHISGYNTAKTVLDNIGRMFGIKIEEENIEKRKELIEKILMFDEENLELMNLIINSLLSMGKHGTTIGKFDEAKNALRFLIELTNENELSTSNVDMTEVYRSMFYLAYISKDKYKDMDAIYEKLLKDASMPEAIKVVCTMQRDYRKAKTPQQKNAITEMFHMNSNLFEPLKDPENPHFDIYLEALRLDCRVQFERIRDEAEDIRADGKRFDADVVMQEKALDENQLKDLMNIKIHLKFLNEQKKKKALVFDPNSEMGLLDLNAQVEAFLGNHTDALKYFSEYYRQSNQAQIHREGARAAKMMGDVKMISALRAGNINRLKVKEAIKIYSDLGMKSLENIDKSNFYQASMRTQKIRAIGMLMKSFVDEMKKETPNTSRTMQLKKEAQEYLETAFEDFEYLNKKWGNLLTQEGRDDIGLEENEYEYYLMSYMGYVFKAAQEFDINIPEQFKNIEQYPFMSKEVVSNGKKFLGKIIDHPEKETKEEGLDIVEDFAIAA
ncbi:MAG: hypothetical protein WC806_05000 [Candidatus Gracilibacteria bacterium]|jgi:hypothetical protein